MTRTILRPSGSSPNLIGRRGADGAELGRQPGQSPSDKKARRVLDMRKNEGLSYRLIGRNLGLSKNTVMDIVRRDAAA